MMSTSPVPVTWSGIYFCFPDAMPYVSEQYLTPIANNEKELDDALGQCCRIVLFLMLSALGQLIEAGGDVTHKAGNKWTPLHCAAAAGDANACTILLEAGADPDAEVSSTTVPLSVWRRCVAAMRTRYRCRVHYILRLLTNIGLLRKLSCSAFFTRAACCIIFHDICSLRELHSDCRSIPPCPWNLYSTDCAHNSGTLPPPPPQPLFSKLLLHSCWWSSFFFVHFCKDEHGLRPVDVIADISATESVTMILNQMRRRSPARSARPPAAFPVPLASPSYSGVGVRERGGVREGGLAGNRPYPTPTSLCASVLPSSRGSGSSVDGSPNTSNPRQPYRPSGKLLVADVPCTNRPAAAETAEGVFEKTPDHDGRDHNSGNTSPKRGSWSRPTVAPRYQTRDCGVDGSKMSRSPDDSPGCVRSNHSTGTPGAPGAAGAAEEVGGAEVQLPQGVPHDRGSATSADGGKGKDGSRLTEGAVPAAAMTAMGLDAGSVAARRHDNTDHEPPAPRAQASPVSA